jgi:hypothetical protein
MTSSAESLLRSPPEDLLLKGMVLMKLTRFLKKLKGVVDFASLSRGDDCPEEGAEMLLANASPRSCNALTVLAADNPPREEASALDVFITVTVDTAFAASVPSDWIILSYELRDCWRVRSCRACGGMPAGAS